MSEELCSWCKHADKCEIRRGLQMRTVPQGAIRGKEVATIREVVVACSEYECLFPNKGAKKEDV